MLSCSKSNDSTNETLTPPAVEEKNFNAYIKDGFTGENGEELLPFRNIYNIVVGDFIPYTITITDKEASSEKYVLVAIKEETKNHQTLQTDYEWYVDDPNGEKKKVETPRIYFDKVGTHTFYIKPLVPGSFQLPFVFQKENASKNIKMPKVNFNAVKIIAYSHGYYTGKQKFTGWEGFHTINRRKYFFKIEDGIDETDIFLTPTQDMSITFTLNYKKHKVVQSFEEGKEYEFHPIEEGIGYTPKLDPNVISEIHFSIKKDGQNELIVKYHNVPIENR